VSEWLEWLGDNSWVGWVAAAALLAAAELISLDFVLLMLAIGAGAGAVTALVGASTVISLGVAVIVSVALLAMLRPNLVARLHRGPELTTGHAALVGRTGIVLTPVGKQTGQIRLSGEVWTARSFDPGLTMAPGAEVEVFEIDGATAVVYPVD